MKIAIHPRLIASLDDGSQLSLVKGIKLLNEIQRCGNLTAASRAVSISYRNGWDLLKQMDVVLGGPTVVMQKGKGSTLTDLGQRLLFAQQLVEARFSPALQSMASEVEEELKRAVSPSMQALKIYASHGFAIELLSESLQNRKAGFALSYRGSLEAVHAFSRGLCDVAGFHVPLGALQSLAFRQFAPFLGTRHSLILLATRRQGIMVAPKNPRAIWSVADLVRPDVRFVNRQPGSGTRLLLGLLLQQAGYATREMPGIDGAELTHAAVAACIVSDKADCGLGVETAARRSGLDFVPLINERYFLLCRTEQLNEAPLQLLRGLLQTNEFRAQINTLPGYDATNAGQVMRVAEAFPES